MKLHFPWPEVAKILDEVCAATEAQTLYGEVTGKGLWLVGDSGVYLMPNTGSGKPTVVYAKECDPTKFDFDTWWNVKRATFGGDDGVEFIDIKDVDGMAAQASTAGITPTYLCIDLTPKSMQISLQIKRTTKKRPAA